MLHKQLEILKVKDHAKLRLALINHKVIYSKECLNWAHKNMKLQNEIHGRNLRNNLNFQINANAYSRVTEKASIVWNNLAQYIKIKTEINSK